MANCENQYYSGRTVVAEYADLCGDVDPATANWLPFGALNVKNFGVSGDTAEATNDDTGGFKEYLLTYKDITFSAEGKATRDDGTLTNQTALLKLFMEGSENIWIRLTFPDVTIVWYAVITEYSRGVTDTDTTTYSITIANGANSIAPVVTDTP